MGKSYQTIIRVTVGDEISRTTVAPVDVIIYNIPHRLYFNAEDGLVLFSDISERCEKRVRFDAETMRLYANIIPMGIEKYTSAECQTVLDSAITLITEKATKIANNSGLTLCHAICSSSKKTLHPEDVREIISSDAPIGSKKSAAANDKQDLTISNTSVGTSFGKPINIDGNSVLILEYKKASVKTAKGLDFGDGDVEVLNSSASAGLSMMIGARDIWAQLFSRTMLSLSKQLKAKSDVALSHSSVKMTHGTPLGAAPNEMQISTAPVLAAVCIPAILGDWDDLNIADMDTASLLELELIEVS